VTPVPRWVEWLAAIASILSLILYLLSLSFNGPSYKTAVQYVLLAVAAAGCCVWLPALLRRAYRWWFLSRLRSLTRPLLPDKLDLTADAFDVAFFTGKNELASKLRDIASKMRGLKGSHAPGEPHPFFPAVLHLFLSGILFGETGLTEPDTVSAVAECYASLIAYYLDTERVQKTAEHCTKWLANRQGGHYQIAHEVMRLVVPAILSRLNKSADPAVLILLSKDSIKLGDMIVHQSQLMMSDVNVTVQGTETTLDGLLDLSYGVLNELVTLCQPGLLENVQEFVDRMLPTRLEYWEKWDETALRPLGKIGFKWENAAKKCVARLGTGQREAYCRKLLERIDGVFSGEGTQRLNAVRAFLEGYAPRQSGTSNRT
jgi:hypothetical protein